LHTNEAYNGEPYVDNGQGCMMPTIHKLQRSARENAGEARISREQGCNAQAGEAYGASPTWQIFFGKMFLRF
jgi:hypothetical protein